MKILKFLSRFLICILCLGVLCTPSYAESNESEVDIGEYSEPFNKDNLEKIAHTMSDEAKTFSESIDTDVRAGRLVPVEVKIGLVFMKALSAMDYVFHKTLVQFTIIFLLLMYAFWTMIEAYRMIKRGLPYKEELFFIFKKGFTVSIWLLILNYGPEKTFSEIITPVLALSSKFSQYILNAVGASFSISVSDTCTNIHNYVAQNAEINIANSESVKLMIDAGSAANIMCLPTYLSQYFYHSIGTALKWSLLGFGRSVVQIFMGGICVYIFIKCSFKYAFMTLGIVADLFLTLLMLPFTALAEALPPNAEKSYVGQMLNGFLSMFNTKKLTDVLSVFINAAIYFVSLSIIISICAALLENIMPVSGQTPRFTTGTAMVSILCGCLILYFADKAEELAKKIGGSIDNSFGAKLQGDTKNMWNGAKNFAGKIFKDWVKK